MTAISTKTPKRLANVADKLGLLRADISNLKKIEKELKDKLIESGLSIIEGDLYRVSVSEHDVTSTDWEDVVLSLKPTPAIRQSIEDNTSTKTRVTVSVHSRLSE